METFDAIKQKFKSTFMNNSDLIVSKIALKNENIGIVYIKGMTDAELITKSVIEPITQMQDENVSCKLLQERIVNVPTSALVEKFDEATEKVKNFWLCIFIEGQSDFLCLDLEKFPVRVPSEPPTSPVLQGPREGFVEDIATNISLLRRRLRASNFVIEDLVIGRHTSSKVKICYLSKIVNKKLVREIKQRLSKIDIDGLIDSHYLVEFLEPKPYSMFKQVGTSEKPDTVCAKLLEGRVAIIVDGSPIVLTLPYLYLEDMQASNDYYGKSQYASYMRIIRILGVLMSVVVPGSYLSLRLYHYKMLPLKFLITISNSTQSLPTTPFLELLFILLLFDVLYEVSLRLPRYLGLATSIVGALILGDTGVKAGLISPPGVMIIALSLISIYTVPDQLYQLSLMRLLFLFIGGTLGLFGIVAGIIFFINHLATFDAYGAAYLAPLTPNVPNDQKDGLIKVPLIRMKTRPESFSSKNKVRQK